ncbi:serine hydrolase domain-containing protein [Pedosphaera parvula]|uniref:Beta-lactamase n=1 Tax=Pedosphaera parvula (strain Ellin514) TaxID=320771 RepID=B9XC76_PEDPL|nr:serine hydrolase domain-containing protein [Pedosphaera parvula]EEF62544.1 beta-lactamase [Pedosphaera parvula Ellin514]
MKRSSLLCFLLCLALAPATFADKIDDLIKAEMQNHHVAGLSMRVLKDGKELKTESYGLANLEWNVPATKDTVFEIGSMTKQFTAACILLLAEDGKLSVDDKISQHLKNTPAAWSNITIRHLLTHTSGIKNYTVMDGFEFSKHLTQEQFIEKMSTVPLSFQPGDAFSYCNTGYNLLGFIVENASGKKYWDFIQERIFTPLQMTSTTSRNPGVILPHRAAGYELIKGKHVNRDYDITDIFSAGAIVSTVEDISKWNAALDGDKFLNATSRQLWWTPMKLNNGKIQNYGFGWFLDPLDNHKNIGHGGATSGFSATIQRFPEDKLAIIILTNADETGLASSIAKKVAKLYFEDTVAAK